MIKWTRWSTTKTCLSSQLRPSGPLTSASCKGLIRLLQKNCLMLKWTFIDIRRITVSWESLILALSRFLRRMIQRLSGNQLLIRRLKFKLRWLRRVLNMRSMSQHQYTLKATRRHPMSWRKNQRILSSSTKSRQRGLNLKIRWPSQSGLPQSSWVRTLMTSLWIRSHPSIRSETKHRPKNLANRSFKASKEMRTLSKFIQNHQSIRWETRRQSNELTTSRSLQELRQVRLITLTNS